jgi:hypothetical protein
LKRVFSSFNRITAHHVRNLLEVEGIRSVVRNEILSSAMGELPPAECETEVWVLKESDFERANQVLLKADSQRNEPPWKCLQCGESCEGQFTQCWRCGATRSV